MTILASSEKYMDKNESMVSISSKYYLSLETLASITKLPCFKKAVFHLNNNRYSRYDYYDIRSIYNSYIFAVDTLGTFEALFSQYYFEIPT